MVLQANGNLPFGEIIDVSFNYTIDLNLTLVWINLNKEGERGNGEGVIFEMSQIIVLKFIG